LLWIKEVDRVIKDALELES